MGALVDVLRKALAAGATSIHFEPKEQGLVVRYRVDGVIDPAAELLGSDPTPLVDQLKQMAGIDTDERRLCQDGRFRLALPSGEVELALTTVRARNGETATVHVVREVPREHRLDQLGLTPAVLASLRAALVGPPGLILLVGPTASGRHTLLYSLLDDLDRDRNAVVTIEDPIRHTLPGVVQLPVDWECGVNMPSLLRTARRLGADVIGMGDVPDFETVDEIGKSVTGGYRMIATAHFHSVRQGVIRLENMGLERWLVAEILSLLVAQRLVRQLCPSCKVEERTSPAEVSQYGLEGARLFRPGGCSACRYTGYAGRFPVTEILPITPEVRAGIRAGERVLPSPTMREVALERARAGLTSVAEAVRVTPPGVADW